MDIKGGRYMLSHEALISNAPKEAAQVQWQFNAIFIYSQIHLNP